MNYYLQWTDCPAPGMLYLDEGQYLFPVLCNNMPKIVSQACDQYIIRVESSYTITAETDSDCDRTCECVDYLALTSENVIIKDGSLAGFYLDLGYYYSISRENPNILVFLLPEASPCHHRSGAVYTLIPREPGILYRPSSHTY